MNILSGCSSNRKEKRWPKRVAEILCEPGMEVERDADGKGIHG